MCRIWTQWHLFHYQFVYACALHAQSRSGCSLNNSNATCTKPFLWQYTTVGLFMCIVLRIVILCCYCVICVSGVLTLWINSQLSEISYTLWCHKCYIWILQTASNSGMYMVSTNIHKEAMKLMSSHPHIHSRLNFTISDTKWFYVFKF